MSLTSLIYLSSATDEMADAELRALLEQARRKNAALDITGLLLHWDGNFIQYVEGPPAAIDRLYETLCRDPRHRDLTVLERSAIAARAYPD